MSCDENAKIRQFIDMGGAIFLITEARQNPALHQEFCIIDYSTVIDSGFEGKTYLGPVDSSCLINEYQEALVKHYFKSYFSVKNDWSLEFRV